MTQEKNQSTAQRSQKKPGFWKTLFGKRWTFPAIYLGAAALIIGIVVAQQMGTSESKPEAKPQQTGQANPKAPDSVNANAGQKLIWPVSMTDGVDAKVTMSAFDPTKDEKANASSILKYDNTYLPQNGVVVGRQDDKSFTVVAAAAGTVKSIEQDPLMGNVVVVSHDNGYETYYASLSDITVKKGDQVIQGQDLAKSGNNLLEADQKNHLHFEVKKDGQNVNPETELPKRDDKTKQ